MSGHPGCDYDVIIAGGGPAGSGAASALLVRQPALKGRVLILERARHPRNKPCGGGLTGHIREALAAVGLSLEVPSYPSPRAEVVFGRLRKTVALEQPVYVIRRAEFDHSLLRQAERAGAVVKEEATVLGVEVDEDVGRVRVRYRDGATGEERRVTGRVLIGADGAGGVVRKHVLGHRGTAQTAPRPIRLFQAELPIASPVGEEMVYDFTPMLDGLRGYLWLFPVPGDRLNVGLMHFQTPHGQNAQWPGETERPDSLSGAALAALCEKHLLRYGVTLPPGVLHGFPTWGYEVGRAAGCPHVCLIGDAAGIDALTGEGIAVALEQAVIAAETILDGFARGNARLDDYSERLRRSVVGRELGLDRVLAELFYGQKLAPDPRTANTGFSMKGVRSLIKTTLELGIIRQSLRSGFGFSEKSLDRIEGILRRVTPRAAAEPHYDTYFWLSLLLVDDEMLGLYAARVSGSLVLADQQTRLFAILFRHFGESGDRVRALAAAIADGAEAG